MNAGDPDDILADIRARFCTRMEKALESLRDAAQLPIEQSSLLLRAEAHKLAGVAATLGYGRVGTAAAKVDAIEGVSPDDPAVAALVLALNEAVAKGPQQ
ncbi:MAG: Hpt domain-containing protein [Novosphingobium sp.]|uniref:Hpt domain-containing protein n=1 Tax=Novosphingobium sp. TaxID=1874826 RepID=UPI003B995733